MGISRAGVLSLGALALCACASPPTATTAPEKRAAPATPPAATMNTGGESNDGDSNDSGLGTLASNGRDLVDCGRKRRLGTRIPRRVCDPNSFNGMYPSAGINMGTARESQPGYGPH